MTYRSQPATYANDYAYTDMEVGHSAMDVMLDMTNSVTIFSMSAIALVVPTNLDHTGPSRQRNGTTYSGMTHEDPFSGKHCAGSEQRSSERIERKAIE